MSSTTTVTLPIFRFKFDDGVVDAVMRFAKIHQHDDRHDYKDAWKEWCIENRDMLEMEVKRLEAAGYEGDVYDKLFKSGRYYFRNKRIGKVEPVERKKYVGLGRDTLKAMDNFIHETIRKVVNVGNDCDDVVKSDIVMSPADAFNAFCEKKKDVLLKEINVLLNDHGLDDSEVSDKLKKTFKNRYFQNVRKSTTFA